MREMQVLIVVPSVLQSINLVRFGSGRVYDLEARRAKGQVVLLQLILTPPGSVFCRLSNVVYLAAAECRWIYA